MRRLAPWLAALVLLSAAGALGAPVPVVHREGVAHGFLAVKAEDGRTVGAGEVTQRGDGRRVTSRVVLRFGDGSLWEETAVFSQERRLRLEEYALVQKGPAFRRELDVRVERRRRLARVRLRERDGEEERAEERLDLPPDLYNGMVWHLLKNLLESAGETEVQVAVFEPEPKVLPLRIARDGSQRVRAGGADVEVVRFVAELPLPQSAVARLLGKKVQGYRFWVVAGEAPVVLAIEGPLEPEGTVFRVECAAPEMPGR